MDHSQIDLKQKKNQAKMLFTSKVMKSQSPLKKQKIHKVIIHWRAIINKTLNFKNFWPKRHFGLPPS